MDDHHERIVQQGLEQGHGILQLRPTWVPRTFGIPGQRLRLHPDDIYVLGPERGGISERWLSSAAQPDNGPLTATDEGLSHIVVGDKEITLRDALALSGVDLIGQDAIDTHGGWVMFSKLFDLMYPVPFHIHQDDKLAASVGRLGKPEAYYFPPQYNFFQHGFPYTYFGLHPETTKEQVVECLTQWPRGDNRILELSRAYALKPGTGWYVPALTLHAPGTLCTYEPQRASDVLCMFQSIVAGFLLVEPNLIWKDVPAASQGDFGYVVDQLDWESNVDPVFKEHHYLEPKSTQTDEAMREEGYKEVWVTYANPHFSAKELTVYPQRTVTIRDAAAYGVICTQGYGRLGPHPVSSPTMIRYGELTEDEYFVTVKAARSGVSITNLSTREPLVLLKHFNPGNTEMPIA